MGNTKLSSVLRQSALYSPQGDDFWPIPNQYIGLEIEMENLHGGDLRNHRDAGSPFWAEHSDGSLRGGIEMVLSQALMGDTLREAISYFFRNFKRYELNPRTSIHVHVNMRQEDETVQGLRNMVVLYYMYEDAFFQIADENRKWCSYCNAFEDTPPAILAAFMTETNEPDTLLRQLQISAQTNTNRYYGLNLNALNKFGTLEFRHFPLVMEEERLLNWVKLIMELKKAASQMAEENLAPWDIFATPDDIPKLLNYMPLHGEELLAHVDTTKAFTRMVNVRSLGTPVRRNRGRILVNRAYARFQEEAKKSGKVIKQKVSKQSLYSDDILRRMVEQERERLLSNAPPDSTEQVEPAPLRARSRLLNTAPRIRVPRPRTTREVTNEDLSTDPLSDMPETGLRVQMMADIPVTVELGRNEVQPSTFVRWGSPRVWEDEALSNGSESPTQRIMNDIEEEF